MDKLSDKIIKNLEKLQYVTGVFKKDKYLSIKLNTGEDVRSQVSQTITKGGGVVVSMNLRGHTLEDAFIQLIAKRKEKEAEK